MFQSINTIFSRSTLRFNKQTDMNYRHLPGVHNLRL